MSKKDFIALADRIRAHNYEAKMMIGPDSFSQGHIQLLADFCATQNPRFNRQRWLDYIAGKCGPSGGAVKQ